MCFFFGLKFFVFIVFVFVVYVGIFIIGFLFIMLNKMDWLMWKRFFGVFDFILLMRWVYDYVLLSMFVLLGYIMFVFLFSWMDINWCVGK